MSYDLIATVIEMVSDANDTRTKDNLDRRVLKLIEELGEIAEAFLECTSLNNKKHKTWADVQEEAADVLIVAIDIALTPISETTSSGHLVDQVRRQLYRINCGFITIIRHICYNSAYYGGDFNSEPKKASQHIIEAVCYAFALCELIWRLDEPRRTQAIISEVGRKLLKWRSGTSTAEAA